MEKIKEQIRRASLQQLQSWWSGDIPDGIDSFVRFGIAVGEALNETPEGIAFLKHQLQSADYGIRIKAIYALTRKRAVEQEIIDNLLEAFTAPDPALKCYALICLKGIKHYGLNREDVEPLIDQTEHFSGELAREALVYLAKAFPKDAATILAKGLQSKVSGIRGSACAEIGEQRIYELLPGVKQLENDPDGYVSTSAKIAVCNLRFMREHT